MNRLLMLFTLAGGFAHGAYIAIPCDAPPCGVQSVSRPATPTELASLTDQLFGNWVGSFQFTQFTLANVRTNTWGFMVGDYSSQGITSSFVYSESSGALLCCTFDTLFRITDLNNNGLVVGYDNAGAFLGRLDTWNTDQHRMALAFRGNFTLTANSRFMAIDDQNRMLLFQDGRSYRVQENPEPGTLALFGLGLGLLALGRKFRWNGRML